MIGDGYCGYLQKPVSVCLSHDQKQNQLFWVLVHSMTVV